MWQPKIKPYKKDLQIRYPCACEVKFDGEFVYWNGQNTLVNKRKNPKTTISMLPNRGIYGELYYGEGKEFYSEIHSHGGYNNKVILFDTDDYGHRPYIQRRTDLEVLGKLGIEITPMYICQNAAEVQAQFDLIIKQGYEGAVVKPLDSYDDSSWVKMKKETTCTLLVKGLRKVKTIPTIVMGTQEKDLCSVSLNGWTNIIQMLTDEKKERGIDSWVVGENKDAYILNSDIRLEILSNSFTPSGKLRNPRVIKIPHQDRPITIGE